MKVVSSISRLFLKGRCDSYIPKKIRPSRVVGLGLNNSELARNEMLSEIVLHDLNKTPMLPFPDDTFDIVVNTVPVD